MSAGSRRLRPHGLQRSEGITRDELAYDLGRRVDDSVYPFEESKEVFELRRQAEITRKQLTAAGKY